MTFLSQYHIIHVVPFSVTAGTDITADHLIMAATQKRLVHVHTVLEAEVWCILPQTGRYCTAEDKTGHLASRQVAQGVWGAAGDDFVVGGSHVGASQEFRKKTPTPSFTDYSIGRDVIILSFCKEKIQLHWSLVNSDS